jgi:starch synthase
VATRVGQLEEVLRDERTALLVPPEHPEAMARAFERLHGDPELKAALGAAARAEALSSHSWEARLDAILADQAAGCITRPVSAPSTIAPR